MTSVCHVWSSVRSQDLKLASKGLHWSPFCRFMVSWTLINLMNNNNPNSPFAHSEGEKLREQENFKVDFKGPYLYVNQELRIPSLNLFFKSSLLKGLTNSKFEFYVSPISNPKSAKLGISAFR